MKFRETKNTPLYLTGKMHDVQDRGWAVGDRVRCRDSGQEWASGTVTSVAPLKVEKDGLDGVLAFLPVEDEATHQQLELGETELEAARARAVDEHIAELHLDRILDVTRLEGGGMAVQTGPTPMVELARLAVARRQEDAAGAGLTLGFRLPCPVPESVECDGARVCQVLDQLIDNALRHTEAGGVRVTLVSEPTGDWARSRLVLTVEDDGPGVPSDLQGRMFEPFVGRPGAGLGLALAHELMKLMGGELTYEPAQGGGSCFRAALEVGNLSGVRMVEG